MSTLQQTNLCLRQPVRRWCVTFGGRVSSGCSTLTCWSKLGQKTFFMGSFQHQTEVKIEQMIIILEQIKNLPLKKTDEKLRNGNFGGFKKTYWLVWLKRSE